MSTEETPVYPDLLLEQINSEMWLRPCPRLHPDLVFNVGFLRSATEEGNVWWSHYFGSLAMAGPDENLYYTTPKTPEIKAKLERIYYNYKLGIEPL